MRSLRPAVLIAAILLGPPTARTAGQEPAPAEPSSPDAAAAAIAAFPATETELLGHVSFLSHPRLRGRDAGSEHAAIAAAYVEAEFLKLGLEPGADDGGYEQGFPLVLVSKDERGVARVEKRCRNVLAWLPGQDAATGGEWLLVGAHYDHLGVGAKGEIYAGADDNASGVAGMLAVARALAGATVRPRHPILFIAFGGEEPGLQGSRHFAGHPVAALEQLRAMINIDMIGRPRFLDRKALRLPKRIAGIKDGPGVGILGGSSCPGLLAIARSACAGAGLAAYAPEDFPLFGKAIEKETAGRGDHAPFEERKIPFLFFSTSEHDDYHEPTDTIEKISARTLWQVAVAIHRTILAIDALPARPLFQEPGPPPK